MMAPPNRAKNQKNQHCSAKSASNLPASKKLKLSEVTAAMAVNTMNSSPVSRPLDSKFVESGAVSVMMRKPQFGF